MMLPSLNLKYSCGFAVFMSRQERRHADQKKSSWKIWIWVALIVAVIAGFIIYNNTKGTGVDYTKYNYKDEVYASPNATTVMDEFSDFQCPFCQAFDPTVRAIRDGYPGKVRLVYKEFPLRTVHEHAQEAAEAAECARDQDRFWAFHDVLFDSKLIDARSLKLHAQGLGLDMYKWQTCMDSGLTKARIQADVLEGQQRGVQGTPTLFINGKQFDGRTVQDIEANIK